MNTELIDMNLADLTEELQRRIVEYRNSKKEVEELEEEYGRDCKDLGTAGYLATQEKISAHRALLYAEEVYEAY